MGEKVPASLQHFAAHSDLPAIDPHHSGDQMLSALATAHEKTILEFRKISALADEYQDYGLVDLLGGLLRDHEKTAWFLRSHL